ncbi:uncharacterized protein [Hyperolius riggenbachi]|uniref:uncharacterized protein n=1 Tax=Hyperolius riggenbachi TaxID=752182 RepID=UPI0035A326E4
MDKARVIFTLLSLCATAYRATTASKNLGMIPKMNVANLPQENARDATNQTLAIAMNFEVVLSDDQIGKTVIVSSEIVPGVDQFQLKITAMQNESVCSYTSCPVPKLAVLVFASINHKTYSYSSTVTGQTLGLNTDLVGGVNVFPQDPEFTGSSTDTASVNVVFFYSHNDPVPKAWINVNSSSAFHLHIESTTTAVSTPFPVTPPSAVFTPAPDVPSYIDMTVQVFVPNSQTGKSVLVSSPISINDDKIQMKVLATKNETLCYNTTISCPEPELVFWIFALINLKTFTYSAAVIGQTLRLNIDLSNGLKVYPQNPQFTASATDTVSIEVNVIYNPSHGLPSLNKPANDATSVNLNIKTTVFASTTTTTTQTPRNSGPSHLDCGPLQKTVMLVLLLVLLLN